MRETLLFIKMMINRREQIHFYLSPYIIDGRMHKHIHFYCWLKYVIYWYTSSKLIVVYISFRSYFGNIKTKLRSKCKTNLCRAHQGLLTYIYITHFSGSIWISLKEDSKYIIHIYKDNNTTPGLIICTKTITTTTP